MKYKKENFVKYGANQPQTFQRAPLLRQHGSGRNNCTTLQSKMKANYVTRVGSFTMIIWVLSFFEENKRCLLILIFTISLPKFVMKNHFKHLYIPPLLYMTYKIKWLQVTLSSALPPTCLSQCPCKERRIGLK